MTTLSRVVVHGAAGRMGRQILRAVSAADDLVLLAAVEHESSTMIGLDAGELAGVPKVGLSVTGELQALERADVAIDFSRPEGTIRLARAAAAARVPCVIGTTGLDESTESALSELAAVVPVVVASNTSVGVAILAHIVRETTKLTGESFDIEIVEMHHRNKVDAPSGTALRLADAALAARGQGRDVLRTGRAGQVGARTKEEIGVLALRGGDVIGDHTVIFAGEGERLELSHKATDRTLFANGALRAARWVIGQPPGRYEMADVLGLR